jgi:O-acetyl-ADP-ribose deacetylase (regulator of RNase III)
MIKMVQGDILNSTTDMIVHQVNCLGVAGAGLAKQIAERYPDWKHEYIKYCFKTTDPKNLLGRVFIYQCPHEHREIASLFGQFKTGKGVQTIYPALRQSMRDLAKFIRPLEKSIAIPFKIGCGLAGGNWKFVSEMIEDEFDFIETEIWELP